MARTRPLRVPVESIGPGQRRLRPEVAMYVARVHRLGVGDSFVAFDPEVALEANGRILSVGSGGREVHVSLDAPYPSAVCASREVTLIQGIGKGDKMDAIVRDGTELGVTRIAPVHTSRTVVKSSEMAHRTARWQRIAIEAARQCGRGDAPKIEPPAHIEEVMAGFGQRPQSARGLLVCLVPEAPRELGYALYSLPPREPFTFVVGPEGGLSSAEIVACEAAGFRTLGLGPFVLRTETVCAAVLGALLVVPSARAD